MYGMLGYNQSRPSVKFGLFVLKEFHNYWLHPPRNMRISKWIPNKNGRGMF